jgi:hypothetical protein
MGQHFNGSGLPNSGERTKNKEQRTSSGLWGSFSIAGYIMRGGVGRGLSGCHNKELMQSFDLVFVL